MIRSRLTGVLVAAACGPAVGVDAGATSGESSGSRATSTDGSSSTTTSTSTSVTSGATVTTAGSGAADTSTSDEPITFIEEPDGGPTYECDQYEQDCPPGQKCMPYGFEDSNTWDATKCTPLAEDPRAVGEPCTVVDSPLSGIDDCEIGSMCWFVDVETNTGTCVAFCVGGANNPTCENECESCVISDASVLILCLPHCHPLQSDCRRGAGCYPVDGGFRCVTDAGGREGARGEACQFINVCDPGLFCAPGDAVPGCTDDGCCAAFCDLAAQDPCPDAAPGVECVPWYDAAPPAGCSDLANVGACLLPEGG